MIPDVLDSGSTYSAPFSHGTVLPRYQPQAVVGKGSFADRQDTLRVSAVASGHRRLRTRCQPLDGDQGVPEVPAVPAQRKAHREYENRISARTRTAGP